MASTTLVAIYVTIVFQECAIILCDGSLYLIFQANTIWNSKRIIFYESPMRECILCPVLQKIGPSHNLVVHKRVRFDPCGYLSFLFFYYI